MEETGGYFLREITQAQKEKYWLILFMKSKS
jgi:hypothetical protein